MMRLLGAMAVWPLLLGGAAAGEPVDPDDAVPGLEVSIGYPRYLQVEAERVTVRLTNGSDELLQVERLAIRSPAFEELPLEDKDITFRPGRRFDLPVALGDVRCDEDPGGSAVEIVVVHGGERWHGRVAIDDLRLREIWEDRCADLDIAATVDVGFGDDFEREGDRLHATLDAELLEPNGWARIEAIRGTVIITVGLDAPDEGPLAAVAADDASAAIPIVLSASRCESHAVIESKKTFHFGVWVSTPEHEAEHIVVQPTGPLLAELEAMIRDCIERFATAD